MVHMDNLQSQLLARPDLQACLQAAEVLKLVLLGRSRCPESMKVSSRVAKENTTLFSSDPTVARASYSVIDTNGKAGLFHPDEPRSRLTVHRPDALAFG